jgi:hypothetical protein
MTVSVQRKSTIVREHIGRLASMRSHLLKDQVRFLCPFLLLEDRLLDILPHCMDC